MLNYTSRPHDVLTMAHELGPRRARRAGAPAGDLPLHHPADAGRDRLDLRREHRPRAAARARARPGRAARPARRRARRRGGRGVPPDRDEPLRGRDPHDAARGGRAVGGALRRALARHAGRPARRLASSSTTTTRSGGPTSGTSSTRLATCTPTRTVTCSRCRCTALRGARARASCPPTSTCCSAGGSLPPEELGAIVGVDLVRPGLLELGARPDRAPARRGRGGRAGGWAARAVIAERIALPGGEVELIRPPDAEALISEESFEHEEFLPYWAELWASAVALAHDVSIRSLRGRRDARAGLRARPPEHRRCAGRRARARHRLVARRGPRHGGQRRAERRGASRRCCCAWGEPDAIVARAPWALVHRVRRALRASQRRPAAGAAAAAGGRARPCAAGRSRPRPRRGLPRRAPERGLDRAQHGQPARPSESRSTACGAARRAGSRRRRER